MYISFPSIPVGYNGTIQCAECCRLLEVVDSKLMRCVDDAVMCNFVMLLMLY